VLGTVLSFHVPDMPCPHAPDDAPPNRKPSESTEQEGITVKTEVSKWEGGTVKVNLNMQLVSNLDAVNVYTSFRDVTMHLWQLWELVLVNSPILVISSAPAQCSEAVFGLVSLIAPVSDPCKLTSNHFGNSWYTVATIGHISQSTRVISASIAESSLRYIFGHWIDRLTL
jgi:hypothetical protein